MPDTDALTDIHNEERDYPDDIELDNERWEELKTELHDDLGRVIDETSIFVLGSYNDEEADRLDAVCEALDDYGYPYIMEDIADLWEFWTTKFKILASRSDYILGIYEHNRGGHEWEAGYIDQKKYRKRTYVFKRTYETRDTEHRHFDGMFAHYMQSMERINQYWEWTISPETDSTEPSTEGLLSALSAFIDDELDS